MYTIPRSESEGFGADKHEHAQQLQKAEAHHLKSGWCLHVQRADMCQRTSELSSTQAWKRASLLRTRWKLHEPGPGDQLSTNQSGGPNKGGTPSTCTSLGAAPEESTESVFSRAATARRESVAFISNLDLDAKDNPGCPDTKGCLYSA